jgi:ubiquinone/menaquinone biosynthesis C-methylase UbiE
MQAINQQAQSTNKFILNTDQYYSGTAFINVYSATLLLNAFQNAGFLTTEGNAIEVEKLKNTILKSQRHERLYFALLDILERHGFIEITNNTIAATAKATAETTKAEIERLSRATIQNITPDPIINDHLWPIASFVREILPNIFEVMREEKTYLEVLFPNNDFSKVEKIYQDNVQTYQNVKLAELVRDSVEQLIILHPNKKIKLLEVGAGTGMGSQKVLEYLKPYSDHVEFWFTDISAGFTRRAKKKFFADYPFMKFKALDISKPVEGQGFEKEDADIVFCTNVVHATESITAVFTHLKDLLKHGGHLFVNDLSERLDWTTVIFGLTEGWWFFKDGEHRIPHSPILAREKFESIFEEFGFEQISSYGLDIIAKKDYPQSIIFGVLNREND